MRAAARLALGAALLAMPLSAHGQLAGLFGSTNGTYCKIKQGDVISAYTQLPSDGTLAFVERMTLRRLASLARSLQFSAIVVTGKCQDLSYNGAPRLRTCKLTAHMENSPEPPAVSDASGKWYGVNAILRDTQDEAAAYPVTTGLMNKGNKCVID